MTRLILIAGLLAMRACVPVSPYQTGGPGLGTPEPAPIYNEPDIYDLPAHCYYDQSQNVICR